MVYEFVLYFSDTNLHEWFEFHEFHGLAQKLCLIMCYWHGKKQQKCFLNIQLEETKINFNSIHNNNVIQPLRF